MKNKDEKRIIPAKNYFILLLICLITIIATIYINAWIRTYKVNSDVSPLLGMVQEITLSDLEVTMSETNIAVLYISNGDDYNLDSEILKRVNANSVNDYFYYMNVDDVSADKSIKSLKSYFDNVKESINVLPMFIYIKDGKAVKVMDSKDRQLTISDFDVLLDSYLDID